VPLSTTPEQNNASFFLLEEHLNMLTDRLLCVYRMWFFNFGAKWWYCLHHNFLKESTFLEHRNIIMLCSHIGKCTPSFRWQLLNIHKCPRRSSSLRRSSSQIRILP